MRKVFLDDLPRRGSFVDWSNSVGCIVKFIYDDIEGEVLIDKYDKGVGKLIICYNGRRFDISRESFKICNIGGILNKYTGDFKLKIGQEIRGLAIIDCKYKKRHRNDGRIDIQKYYKYKCNKCGFDGNVPHYKNKEYKEELWIEECHLLKGKGCACCANQIVTEKTSIFTTDYWMVNLGVDMDESKKFRNQSNKKIKCICPHCGGVDYKICGNIYRNKSIFCTCGDGFSYPEKIMYSVLKQLGVEFQTQYNSSWTNNRRYDFYISNSNIIIETNGLQHYKECGGVFNSLEEEQENDKLKKGLALSNGIKHYIELDCRESNLEWIKKSILNSNLIKLFDLSNIDWLKCEEFALSNLVIDICNEWSNKEEWEKTSDLAKRFKISNPTVVKYLTKGSEINWCEYDAIYEKRKCVSKLGKLNGKRVSMFKNGELIGIFESCHELSRVSEELFGVNLSIGHISAVCRGDRKSHKGYTFKYVVK